MPIGNGNLKLDLPFAVVYVFLTYTIIQVV